MSFIKMNEDIIEEGGGVNRGPRNKGEEMMSGDEGVAALEEQQMMSEEAPVFAGENEDEGDEFNRGDFE
jgi:hypothetical protein